MCARLNGILKGLDVYPEKMMENLGKTRGLVFSQRVLMALMERGIDRDSAYQIVQDSSRKVWADSSLTFQEALASHEEIKRHCAPGELAALFEYTFYLRHVDEIYGRFGM